MATVRVHGTTRRRIGAARRRYRQFVPEAVPHGRRAELQEGGLRRSAGGWEGLAAPWRGCQRWTFGERLLGSGPFGDGLLAQVPAADPGSPARAWHALPLRLARLATAFGGPAAEGISGSRRRPVAAARAAIGAVAVRGLGLPVARGARALGVTPLPLLRGVERGRMLLQAHKLEAATLAREAQKG